MPKGNKHKILSLLQRYYSNLNFKHSYSLCIKNIRSFTFRSSTSVTLRNSVLFRFYPSLASSPYLRSLSSGGHSLPSLLSLSSSLFPSPARRPLPPSSIASTSLSLSTLLHIATISSPPLPTAAFLPTESPIPLGDHLRQRVKACIFLRHRNRLC